MPAEVYLKLVQQLPPLLAGSPASSSKGKPIYFRKIEKIMETHKRSFKLTNDISELKTLNQQLYAFGKTIGLPKSFITEINICLDELFTNIVSYGYEDNLEHLIFFRFSLIDDVLTIEVEDEGIPFNPLGVKKPEKVNDLENIPIGGLGIYIVKELMDDICYKRYRSKNNLTLKKSIGADKFCG